MGINWYSVTDARLKHLYNRNLQFFEINIDGWHYWIFYQLQIDEKQIEAVFFVREQIVNLKREPDINLSFQVPVAWLENANNKIFQILKENLDRQLT